MEGIIGSGAPDENSGRCTIAPPTWQYRLRRRLADSRCRGHRSRFQRGCLDRATRGCGAAPRRREMSELSTRRRFLTLGATAVGRRCGPAPRCRPDGSAQAPGDARRAAHRAPAVGSAAARTAERSSPRPSRGGGPDPPGAEDAEARRHQAQHREPVRPARDDARRHPGGVMDFLAPRFKGPCDDRRVFGGRHPERLRAVRLPAAHDRLEVPLTRARRPERMAVSSSNTSSTTTCTCARAPGGSPPRSRRLRHQRDTDEDAQRGGGDAVGEEHDPRRATAQRPEGGRAAGATSVAITSGCVRCT